MRLAPTLVALALSILALSPVLADEGQWPPDQLPALDWNALTARGLTLSPKDIWDANGRGIAEAIVNLEGCSAGFVSAEGLVISNHHCVYDAVQEHSTAAHDYIADGFLAKTRADELPAKGQRILVLRRIEDVTAAIRPAAEAAGDDVERIRTIERLQKGLVAQCEKKPATRCRVGAYYGGLRYVLFESLEIRDVRLVYAPPVGVGDFGGEVDNFAWPRHTGDFSFVRAYVAPDGSSAEFSPKNVPYKPARFLPIEPKGIRPGDLVMVLGYPGRTQRYLPASGVERDVTWFYPERERLAREWKATLEDASRGQHESEIRVAAMVKTLANTLKNAEGMRFGFARNHVLEQRREQERQLTAWITEKPERREKYESLLTAFDALYTRDRETRDQDLLLASLPRASKPLGAALTILRWSRERLRPDLEREEGYQDRDRDRVRAALEKMQKDYDPRSDRAALRYFLGRMLALPRPVPGFAAALGVEGKDAVERAAALDRWLDGFYAGTGLAIVEGRLAAFRTDRAGLELSKDPAIALARALEPERDAAERRDKSLAGALARLKPAYAELLMAWKGGRVYPDANSTLRIAFATVKGYAPKDGLVALPQTTLDGLAAKATGEWPFKAPERLLKAAGRRDFGRWAQDDLGTVPVDFLSDADTTGGNSGSPVLNGRGALVGLNFDRVFENVAGDYGWNPAYSRNVMVDIRYIGWVLDRVEGAAGLVRELGLE